jgi:hypothetical protein
MESYCHEEGQLLLFWSHEHEVGHQEWCLHDDTFNHHLTLLGTLTLVQEYHDKAWKMSVGVSRWLLMGLSISSPIPLPEHLSRHGNETWWSWTINMVLMPLASLNRWWTLVVSYTNEYSLINISGDIVVASIFNLSFQYNGGPFWTLPQLPTRRHSHYLA